jgi:hypothetical protein
MVVVIGVGGWWSFLLVQAVELIVDAFGEDLAEPVQFGPVWGGGLDHGFYGREVAVHFAAALPADAGKGKGDASDGGGFGYGGVEFRLVDSNVRFVFVPGFGEGVVESYDFLAGFTGFVGEDDADGGTGHEGGEERFQVETDEGLGTHGEGAPLFAPFFFEYAWGPVGTDAAFEDEEYEFVFGDEFGELLPGEPASAEGGEHVMGAFALDAYEGRAFGSFTSETEVTGGEEEGGSWGRGTVRTEEG